MSAEDEIQGLRQDVGDVGDHNQGLESENNMLRRSNEERDGRILRYMDQRDTALAALEKERAEKERLIEMMGVPAHLLHQQIIGLEGQILDLRRIRTRVESRYTALVAALKKVDPETLGGNCAACHGLGQDDNANFFCHECAGTGWIGLGALLDPEASPKETE